MQKVLKVIGIVLSIVVIVVGFGAMYYNRERTLDLTELLPPEIEVCGNKIGPDDQAYKALHKWLQINKGPWKNSPASYAPMYQYKGFDFMLNVGPHGAVLNAPGVGGWSQVVISAPTESILGECSKN